MRLPVSWLGEFVTLPDDVTAEQLLASFVRVGFEEEDIHTFGVSGPVVVGQVCMDHLAGAFKLTIRTTHSNLL